MATKIYTDPTKIGLFIVVISVATASGGRLDAARIEHALAAALLRRLGAIGEVLGGALAQLIDARFGGRPLQHQPTTVKMSALAQRLECFLWVDRRVVSIQLIIPVRVSYLCVCLTVKVHETKTTMRLLAHRHFQRQSNGSNLSKSPVK